MNILTDKLPNCANIGGKLYPINTDYQIGIVFEQLMFNDELSPEEKFKKAKMLYFGDDLPSSELDEETTDKILWFYNCGKGEKKKAGTSQEHIKRVYDFEYDSKWIFAAFREQYQIQLDSDMEMHWWKFRALFDSLSENTEFVKIMGYRAVKITDKMTTAQKRFYQKMKRLHKLPISKAEEKRINDVEDALINGKSLKNVL